MKKSHLPFFIILSIIVTTGCDFQPNNAESIGIIKIADDTLDLDIADSYYKIKKYTTHVENDTLFIDVKSIYHPNNHVKEILIFIPKNVDYIKLQRDELYHRDSIPWKKDRIKRD